MNTLANNQLSLIEYLKKLPKVLRLILCLLGSALLAYYLPLLIIVATGPWRIMLTDIGQIALSVIILSALNLLGNKIGHILRTGFVFMFLVSGVTALQIAQHHTWSEWKYWWINLFFPTAGILLNAWLFLRFKRATEE